MTDPDVTPDATSESTKSVDAGDRGSLQIADRVVERVATIAAAEVDGIVPSGSVLAGALGHRYPRADATVAGDRVRVHVEVAALWPSSLAEVSDRVRTRVGDQLGALVGLTVDAVDVTVATLVTAPTSQPRRLR